MHYDYSFKYIIDNGIIDKKFEVMKNHSTEDTTEIINCIKEYISGK